jgi:ABC-type uncharacterized transport system substrate-binding protein
MMHGREKSDSAILAVKSANKVARPVAEQTAADASAAEPVERRAETKGNASQQSTHRTQSRASVSQALERIRQAFAVVTQGRSRMRESCTYGSARGAPSNGRPYRDRRSFITLLGGAAAWPLAAEAQLPRERMRRIGVLTPLTANDPEAKTRFEAFAASLRQLGWSDGENLRIEVLWGGGGTDRMRRNAAELVALAPDVIVTTGSATTAAALQETRTIPIVFVQVADPVGGGYVESLPRPGGNATGFTVFEYGISGKWLELLKGIAPRVTQVAILRDTTIAAGAGQFGAIQSIAPSFGVELRPISLLDDAEIERAITAFARIPNGGLIAVAGSGTAIHRRLIIRLAAEFRLPAVYPYRYYANEGGLISYGPDNIDLYRRAASYVDRILKGEKPADLPVQAPTKYELVINLKTAKALGLEVAPSLLARADEVIE